MVAFGRVAVRAAAGSQAHGLLTLIQRLDAAVEGWTASRRTGPLDTAAHVLSSAADRSKLWVGLSALRAGLDGERGRRAAIRALATIAIESALIHSVVKRIGRRRRPEVKVELRFRTRRPANAAFPSGHAASAATAAILIGDGLPGWSSLLALLAAAVGWSRVQTGLHHTSDVLGGLALGASLALAVKRMVPRTSFR